jgi:hypothetical protein
VGNDTDEKVTVWSYADVPTCNIPKDIEIVRSQLTHTKSDFDSFMQLKDQLSTETDTNIINHLLQNVTDDKQLSGLALSLVPRTDFADIWFSLPPRAREAIQNYLGSKTRFTAQTSVVYGIPEPELKKWFKVIPDAADALRGIRDLRKKGHTPESYTQGGAIFERELTATGDENKAWRVALRQWIGHVDVPAQRAALRRGLALGLTPDSIATSPWSRLIRSADSAADAIISMIASEQRDEVKTADFWDRLTYLTTEGIDKFAAAWRGGHITSAQHGDILSRLLDTHSAWSGTKSYDDLAWFTSWLIDNAERVLNKWDSLHGYRPSSMRVLLADLRSVDLSSLFQEATTAHTSGRIAAFDRTP